jgi:hypothetical protein
MISTCLNASQRNQLHVRTDSSGEIIVWVLLIMKDGRQIKVACSVVCPADAVYLTGQCAGIAVDNRIVFQGAGYIGLYRPFQHNDRILQKIIMVDTPSQWYLYNNMLAGVSVHGNITVLTGLSKGVVITTANVNAFGEFVLADQLYIRCRDMTLLCLNTLLTVDDFLLGGSIVASNGTHFLVKKENSYMILTRK